MKEKKRDHEWMKYLCCICLDTAINILDPKSPGGLDVQWQAQTGKSIEQSVSQWADWAEKNSEPVLAEMLNEVHYYLIEIPMLDSEAEDYLTPDEYEEWKAQRG